MKNSKLIFYSFVNSLGVLAYVIAVALIMQNGGKVFGKTNNLLGSIVFLLLFVISATIVGTLVLGRPILLYLDGLKKEAVKLFSFTVGWLLVFIIIVFAIRLSMS